MSSKYLANGTIIGGHYKIIDILGEDDFEILYLVKNIHREGSFFVIKELFLEVFSERKGNSVETIPEAQGVFNKRKAEIIREIDNLPRKHIKDEIKVFAYFEENNTIYSCMAYTPNAKVEAYLQFEPKEDTKLPRLEELTQIVKEDKKSSSLLLIGVVFLTVIGALILAYNQYGDKLKALNIWNGDKKHIEVNITKEKNNTLREVDKVVESNITQTKEKKDLMENNFSLVNIPKKEISVIRQEPLLIEENINKEEVNETNLTKKIVEDINITKDNQDIEANLSKKILDDRNITEIEQEKEANLSKKEKIEEVSQSSQKDSNLSEIFSDVKLHKFLNDYMNTTAHASSKKIMKLYDNKISRYFQFKNITPAKVGKSVRAYNRKWKHRSFKLLDFKVLKRYKKNGVNYCNIRTRTKWSVSNSSGKRKSGYSKGFMTIKDTKDGFKVKAIYGIK